MLQRPFLACERVDIGRVGSEIVCDYQTDREAGCDGPGKANLYTGKQGYHS